MSPYTFAKVSDPMSPTLNESGRLAGIELGGTKCIATLGSGPDMVVDQVEVPTMSPEETFQALHGVLDRWWQASPFTALGLASFGPIALDRRRADYGRILTTTKPGWSGSGVAHRLSQAFPVPCTIDTDVNGAAFAEIAWGSGAGLADFAYITVGTGVGVGLIVNGAATRGIGHSELGHIRVPRMRGDTWSTGCPFHSDCVEGLASGTAVRMALGDVAIDSVEEDHPIWQRVAHALAMLCHTLVCSTGPLRIAIGGGVMTRQPHLLALIEPLLVESLAGYLPLPGPAPFIVAPTLGAQAGPLGSIALARQSLAEIAGAKPNMLDYLEGT